MNRRELFGAVAAGIAALVVPATVVAKEDYWIPLKVQQSGERRIFYIDMRHMSNEKQEKFMQRMREQFRKKKVRT